MLNYENAVVKKLLWENTVRKISCFLHKKRILQSVPKILGTGFESGAQTFASFLRKRTERQTQLFAADTQLGQRRLDGNGIDIGEQRFNQGQTVDLKLCGSLKISTQTGVCQRFDRPRSDIGQNGDNARSAKRHHGGDLIVVTAPYGKTVFA